MSFPAPFTQSQLQIALGGAAAYMQLFDKELTGNPNDVNVVAMLVEVQNAAAADLYSVLQVVFDPHDTTFQNAVFTQQKAVTIGVYWSWHKSTGGQAVPPANVQAYADAMAALKEARSGLRSLGTDVDPASNSAVQTVTVDSTGQRILRGNMNGFC